MTYLGHTVGRLSLATVRVMTRISVIVFALALASSPALAQPADPAAPAAAESPTQDATFGGNYQAPNEDTHPQGAPDNSWRHHLALYGFFAGIEGEVGVLGLAPVETDISGKDMFKTLRGGFLAFYRGEKGRGGLQVDVVYMKAGDDVTNGTFEADVELDQLLLSFDTFLNVWEAVEVVFGVRYIYLNGKLELTGPMNNVQVERSRQWIDPIVGLQWHPRLTEKLSLFTRFDIGAGMSDSTWQLLGMISYHPTNWVSLTAGYRIVDYNYDHADEGDGEKFVYKIRTLGPVLGTVFHF